MHDIVTAVLNVCPHGVSAGAEGDLLVYCTQFGDMASSESLCRVSSFMKCDINREWKSIKNSLKWEECLNE